MKLKESFHSYAVITIIFWSLAPVMTRLSLQYFSSTSLAFLRFSFASVALLAVIAITKMKLPKKQDIPWFALSGFVGFFLYMIVFNTGCQTVTSGTVSVLLATVPVITAIFARFIYKEKLSLIKWSAIVVEFSGVIVLTLMDSTFSFKPGIAWLILGALLLSIYNILQRKLTITYSGLHASSYSILFGTLFLAIFLPRTLAEAQSATPITFVYIAIMGVFSSAIAYACWSVAFKKAPSASSVSNYMFVSPFLASLTGFLLAGEKLDMPTLIGGGIILLGVFVFNFGDKLFGNIAS